MRENMKACLSGRYNYLEPCADYRKVFLVFWVRIVLSVPGGVPMTVENILHQRWNCNIAFKGKFRQQPLMQARQAQSSFSQMFQAVQLLSKNNYHKKHFNR